MYAGQRSPSNQLYGGFGCNYAGINRNGNVKLRALSRYYIRLAYHWSDTRTLCNRRSDPLLLLLLAGTHIHIRCIASEWSCRKLNYTRPEHEFLSEIIILSVCRACSSCMCPVQIVLTITIFDERNK